MPVRAVPRLVGRSCAEQSGHVWVRKPSRNLPVASKTSVLAAEKTGQVLVRTPDAREPQRFQSLTLAYVRRSEVSKRAAIGCQRRQSERCCPGESSTRNNGSRIP